MSVPKFRELLGSVLIPELADRDARPEVPFIKNPNLAS